MTAAARRRLARALAAEIWPTEPWSIDTAAAAVDGGLGVAAVAAIAAVPPGPRRELEIAVWVRRARAIDGPIALMITPTTTDAELAALVDLQVALEVTA